MLMDQVDGDRGWHMGMDEKVEDEDNIDYIP